MKLEFDTLQYANMLECNGFSQAQSRAMVEQLSSCEFYNLYNGKKVDQMLSETIEKVFREHDRKTAEADKRFREEAAEMRAEYRSDRRWTVGTIITTGIALAGYLSVLIHMTH